MRIPDRAERKVLIDKALYTGLAGIFNWDGYIPAQRVFSIGMGIVKLTDVTCNVPKTLKRQKYSKGLARQAPTAGKM